MARSFRKNQLRFQVRGFGEVKHTVSEFTVAGRLKVNVRMRSPMQTRSQGAQTFFRALFASFDRSLAVRSESSAKAWRSNSDLRQEPVTVHPTF